MSIDNLVHKFVAKLHLLNPDYCLPISLRKRGFQKSQNGVKEGNERIVRESIAKECVTIAHTVTNGEPYVVTTPIFFTLVRAPEKVVAEEVAVAGCGKLNAIPP